MLKHREKPRELEEAGRSRRAQIQPLDYRQFKVEDNGSIPYIHLQFRYARLLVSDLSSLVMAIDKANDFQSRSGEGKRLLKQVRAAEREVGMEVKALRGGGELHIFITLALYTYAHGGRQFVEAMSAAFLADYIKNYLKNLLRPLRRQQPAKEGDPFDALAKILRNHPYAVVRLKQGKLYVDGRTEEETVIELSNYELSVPPFCASRYSSVYHKRDCPAVNHMLWNNKRPFASAGQAEKSGYVPHTCAQGAQEER